MTDSKLSAAHRDPKIFDSRLVDKAWRKDSKLPVIDIEVPNYELPLPEGIGEDKDHMSQRQIEETWKERLHEATPPPS